MHATHQLLRRARRDYGCGRRRFVIGYYDRMIDAFRRMPRHRICAVLLDGALMWLRPPSLGR